MFSGTVLDNIRVGKEQATETEVTEALTIAQALDFVNEREGQLTSTISQGGKDLSKASDSVFRSLLERRSKKRRSRSLTIAFQPWILKPTRWSEKPFAKNLAIKRY